ncbi:hypothetical protein M0802_011233 [Mischocyttarus mexicanus]|nr:hypothetical protein M0802_011233 [Mischocyttarus mexicanus]
MIVRVVVICWCLVLIVVMFESICIGICIDEWKVFVLHHLEKLVVVVAVVILLVLIKDSISIDNNVGVDVKSCSSSSCDFAGTDKSPPTFKTATPTSRTQLKLQLMREQLQEQERREAEFRQSLQQQRPAAAHPRPVPPTPLSTIGVDVPPQVLQVRTLLENPTRYHVVQKQKNQVRQYLQESFRGVDCNNGVNAVLGSVGNDSSVGGTPVDVGIVPVTAAASAPVPPAPVVPMVVHSAPPGPTVHHQKPQHPHLASYPRVPGLLSHGNPVSASPDPTTGAMSPGLSSVATSNSESERRKEMEDDEEEEKEEEKEEEVEEEEEDE